MKLAKSPSEAEQIARELIGKTLVTYQSGPDGQTGVAASGRGRSRHRSRALSRPRPRSLHPAHRADGEQGGRRRDREDRRRAPRKDPQGLHQSGRRAAGVRSAAARLRARAERRFAQEGRQDDAGALPRLHRRRRVDPRDQSADRHQERRPARARREDELRRQRALSPRRHSRTARHQRRGPARGRGVEVLAQLHPPRRHHRLHGERRRARDGDDGHHQAVGRGAGELPGRRRRRQRRADQERVPHPDDGQERQGGADQHLRRHPALRRARRRRDCRGERAGRARADRDSHEGHQRRSREEDAGRERVELCDRRHDGRGRRQGGGARGRGR